MAKYLKIHKALLHETKWVTAENRSDGTINIYVTFLFFKHCVILWVFSALLPKTTTYSNIMYLMSRRWDLKEKTTVVYGTDCIL